MFMVLKLSISAVAAYHSQTTDVLRRSASQWHTEHHIPRCRQASKHLHASTLRPSTFRVSPCCAVACWINTTLCHSTSSLCGCVQWKHYWLHHLSSIPFTAILRSAMHPNFHSCIHICCTVSRNELPDSTGPSISPSFTIFCSSPSRGPSYCSRISTYDWWNPCSKCQVLHHRCCPRISSRLYSPSKLSRSSRLRTTFLASRKSIKKLIGAV